MAKRKPPTKTVSAATARTQFGKLLELSQRKGIRFVVSRNGEPAVVIMPIADYLERTGDTPETLMKVHGAAKRRGLDLLKLSDVNSEVAPVRRRLQKKPRRP